MCSGGHDDCSSRWNEKAATLEAIEQRVKLFVSSKKQESYLCGPRLLFAFDPERDTFRHVRDKLTNLQLEAADGSNAQTVVKIIRLSLCPKETQGDVRLLLDFLRLDFPRRNDGETTWHWTRRFTLQYTKVGLPFTISNSCWLKRQV